MRARLKRKWHEYHVPHTIYDKHIAVMHVYAAEYNHTLLSLTLAV